MASATLSFNLPEERDEHKRACQADDFYCVLNHLEGELRNHLKHNTHPNWDDVTVEEVRKILWDLVADYNVQLD